MNILNKLTMQSLKLNRKRTIVTIIGIILSAAMICGVVSIAVSFQDLIIQSTIETDGNFHASFIDVPVGNTKYITENAYSETSMFSRDAGFASFPQSKSVYQPYILVKEYDATALNHMPITLKEGRFPEADNEIVISEETAFIAGYEVGQEITLDIGSRLDNGIELINDSYSETEVLNVHSSRTFIVTGMIAKPYFEGSRAAAYTAVTYLDADKLSAADTVNVSILAKSPKNIFEKVPEMAENAKAADFEYNNELLRWSGISDNDQFNSTLAGITLIIILLIMVGSVTVIYNAFAISVSERKKQFGMLASIGATPRQIKKTVFFEGAVLGLIGIPLGILSGLGGIGVTLSVVNRLVVGSMFSENISLRLVVSPVSIAAAVIFVGLIIFLSAYIPANRAAKTSPIDAIRLTADIAVKAKKLKTSKLTRALFGIEGELALKNLKRNGKKYRTTVFSLFISIVLFISFASFMKYGFISTDMYFQDVNFNVVVNKYNVPEGEQLDFYRQVADLEDVEQYSVVRTIHADANLNLEQFGPKLQELYLEYPEQDSDNGYIKTFAVAAVGREEFSRFVRENGLDPADYQDADNFRGILVNKSIERIDGKLVESEPMAMGKGEILELAEQVFNDTDIPAEFTIEIGTVTDELPLGASYTGLWGPVTLVVSEGVFDAVRANFSAYNPEGVMSIKTEKSSQLVAAVQELNMQNPQGTLFAEDVDAAKNQMARIKTAVSIFLYGFIVLITLIGVTNIFNTISTNVALRRREFAMLKSVGMTPKGFSRMINYESIFYGMKSLLYGLPVGIAVSVWMHNAFGNMFDFAFVLPVKEILACIAGVFIIVFITMLHASAKLKTDNIVDALKTENL